MRRSASGNWPGSAATATKQPGSWRRSCRCTGRALYMLGERARERRQLAHAEELLRGSVEAIVLAGQSFVLVNALETLSAVCFARGRPRHTAVLLCAAHATRAAATTYMRPIQTPDEALRRSLVKLSAPRPSRPLTVRASDCLHHGRCSTSRR